MRCTAWLPAAWNVAFVPETPTPRLPPTDRLPSVRRALAPLRYRFVSIAARVLVPQLSCPFSPMLKVYLPAAFMPEKRYEPGTPEPRTCIPGPPTSDQIPSMVGSELGVGNR